MVPLDTEIHCPVCRGTKINPGMPRYGCGVCSRTGLSTESYDQRRQATTVTVRVPLGRLIDVTSPNKVEAGQAQCNLVPLIDPDEKLRNVFVHTATRVAITPNKVVDMRLEVVCLISWDNPLYPQRLARFRAGELYAKD